MTYILAGSMREALTWVRSTVEEIGPWTYVHSVAALDGVSMGKGDRSVVVGSFAQRGDAGAIRARLREL